MAVIVIIIVLWLFTPTKKQQKRLRQPRARKTGQQGIVVYDPPVISPADIERQQKKQERERKAQADREIAAADVDRLEAQKATLLRLLDSIEVELEATADQRRITTLLSKQAGVESKLYAIDRRIDAAYAKAWAY